MFFAGDISNCPGEGLESLLGDRSSTGEATSICAFPQAHERLLDHGKQSPLVLENRLAALDLLKGLRRFADILYP